MHSFDARWVDWWWNRESICEKNLSWESNIKDREAICWMI